jgi:hypothetical protein
MNLATGVRIEISVEENDAVANNQEAVKWDVFGTDVIQGFGEDSGIKSLALRARSLPCRAWKLVRRDTPEWNNQQNSG